MALNVATLDDLPSIEDVLNINLSKFTNFAANNCGYTEITHGLMVNWVHTVFLKAKATESKEENPNLW